MPNFTKKAIKDTFIGLLEKRPLSEITVKNIVEECGINRNSFYYHFRDLPALIEEIIEEEADKIIQSHPSVNSVVECLDALLEFSTSNKRAIYHVYRSVNRDLFERYLMKISLYFTHTYLSTALGDMEIPQEDLELIENYYKCVCFGLAIDWLECGMKDEYKERLHTLLELRANMASDIANMLKDQL